MAPAGAYPYPSAARHPASLPSPSSTPLLTPRLLNVPEDAPSGPAMLEAWRRCFDADPTASIHLRPDVALAPWLNRPHPPTVYARWNLHPQAAESIASLAVLEQRPFELTLLPRLTLKLPGFKVIESRLLGDRSPEAIAAFIERLRRLLTTTDAQCVLFRDVEVGSPLWNALAEAGHDREVAVSYPSDPTPHWWIRFPQPSEDYWKQFSKKTRYNFRYRAKHLDHTVRCIRRRDELDEFLEKGLALANSSWKSRKLGLQSTLEGREFWELAADLGMMRCYLMEYEGRCLAYATGIQCNGVFSYEETAYDPACAAKSPGQVLLYRMLEDLIASDTPEVFDFGFGHADYKEVFSNHRTDSGPVALVRRTRRTMAAVNLQKLARRCGRTARNTLRRAGVLSLLRQFRRA